MIIVLRGESNSKHELFFMIMFLASPLAYKNVDEVSSPNASIQEETALAFVVRITCRTLDIESSITKPQINMFITLLSNEA